jgi:Domain of unknown function (DUF4349)
MKNIVLCFLFLLTVFACKDAVSGGKKEESTSYAGTESAPTEAVSDAKSVAMDFEKPTETQIIRTSTLQFETDDLNESYLNIQKAVAKCKGNLQNDVSGKNESAAFRNLTIRVPNTNFIAFLDEISKGVNHFDRKEISSEDVTEQYIDLESRMNSKKTLEKRYLQLLQKANKVSEIIEIEAKLSEIREEIEAKEGQFKYLKNQIAMSTVTIEMYTNDAMQSGETVSFFGKIWNEIKSGFNSLSSFILGLVSIWPFLVISILIFIFIKRKFKKKEQ